MISKIIFTYKMNSGTSKTLNLRAVDAPVVCLFIRATFTLCFIFEPTASHLAPIL